jgi:hypothetical protein
MLPLERMRYSVMASSGRPSGQRARAIGSAGERLVHTEEVTGSIPVSPTQWCSHPSTFYVHIWV